ncbi:MAG: hypothetical protein PVI57_00905 [Gemmatimonadota bacterium]|jgi:polyhydroxyalkanoate synthesis regulator phasin
MTTSAEGGEAGPENPEQTSDRAGYDEGRGPSEESGGGQTGPKERISDGLRQGLGVLSAFKDAMEETIREARERGELSSDRAREMVRDAMGRAKEAAGDARERLDFATRDDLDRLREQLDELRVRLENLEQRMPQSPDVGPGRPAGEEPGG